MDAERLEILAEIEYAWRGVACAINNYKLLQNKGRYHLAQFNLEPRVRVSRPMAVEMGMESYLAKRMLES